MKFRPQYGNSSSEGFTLVEVAIAMSIAGLVLGGIILGYVQMLHRAEWSAYSLAAHSLAQQGMEQARAAKWDTLAAPSVDELLQANFPERVEVLDVPLHSDHLVLATNITIISVVRSNPPLKAVQVDCVWAYHNGRLFTNRVVTYRAPDQ
jgi:prepilin-type N-terminal cleavage/methylation domain-containing protein